MVHSKLHSLRDRRKSQFLILSIVWSSADLSSYSILILLMLLIRFMADTLNGHEIAMNHFLPGISEVFAHIEALPPVAASLPLERWHIVEVNSPPLNFLTPRSQLHLGSRHPSQPPSCLFARGPACLSFSDNISARPALSFLCIPSDLLETTGIYSRMLLHRCPLR